MVASPILGLYKLIILLWPQFLSLKVELWIPTLQDTAKYGKKGARVTSKAGVGSEYLTHPQGLPAYPTFSLEPPTVPISETVSLPHKTRCWFWLQLIAACLLFSPNIETTFASPRALTLFS